MTRVPDNETPNIRIFQDNGLEMLRQKLRRASCRHPVTMPAYGRHFHPGQRICAYCGVIV